MAEHPQFIAAISEAGADILRLTNPHTPEEPMTDPTTPALLGARKLAADIMVAVRQARFPKEYADEAHDEFEARLPGRVE